MTAFPVSQIPWGRFCDPRSRNKNGSLGLQAVLDKLCADRTCAQKYILRYDQVGRLPDK